MINFTIPKDNLIYSIDSLAFYDIVDKNYLLRSPKHGGHYYSSRKKVMAFFDGYVSIAEISVSILAHSNVVKVHRL